MCRIQALAQSKAAASQKLKKRIVKGGVPTPMAAEPPTVVTPSAAPAASLPPSSHAFQRQHSRQGSQTFPYLPLHPNPNLDCFYRLEVNFLCLLYRCCPGTTPLPLQQNKTY